jgi:hypothetical protein
MRTSLALSLLLVTVACRKPSDLDNDGLLDQEDCNPALALGAEACDGFDNDCNGEVDDAAPDAATWFADADHDGYGDAAASTTACDEPVGFTSNSEDCDDADPAYHPGATEAGCDGTADFNCDGQVGIVDADGDGASACVDCNDNDEDVLPGAEELCNEEDDDCDGFVDNNASDAEDYAIDVDDDGHGSTRYLVAACAPPDGYVLAILADDCDDLAASTYPGAPEDCDGVDNDCDGTIDDAAKGKGAYYLDSDEDGFGDGTKQVLSCVRPVGYVSNFDDCDDANTGINPAANESCSDTLDRNCDGAVGNDDNDSDGTVACDDCDDGRAVVEPGAPELCDAVDNDCDALIDETAPTWYADLDGDKHGYDRLVAVACEAPAGYVATFDDCDDFDKSSFPGATEACDGADNDCDTKLMVGESDTDGDGFLACDDDCDDAVATRSPLGLELCNGLDDDCDGAVDEAGAADEQTWFADADSDGFGSTSVTKSGCDAPTGYVGNDRDCNDLTKAAYPGNPELCDSFDNDCDGEVDEAGASGATTWYADGDGDGYGGVISTKACAVPAGFNAKTGDCDDGDAARKPGATEACNGVDDDCNGAVPTNEADADLDGFRACGDCDDTSAQIRPGNVELCNGKDDNCSGAIDENAADATTFYKDADNDKFGTNLTTTRACTLPVGYAAVGNDCLDTDAKYYPGADPVCDTKDHDCDGHIDFDEDDDGYAADWCGGKDCDDNNTLLPDVNGKCVAKDCLGWYNAGFKTDGIYAIDPDGTGAGLSEIDAYCDMTNGGYTLCASLTKGYVPADALYNQQRYSYQARAGNARDYVFDIDSPARYTSTWNAPQLQNHGQFCRWIGSGATQTKIEAKSWNWSNNCSASANNSGYSAQYSAVYAGNLFTTWMTNSSSTRTFSKLSGSNTLYVQNNNNGYGGPYTTPSVGWGGSGDQTPYYTHSTNPWASSVDNSVNCVGCTNSSGCYANLPYANLGPLGNMNDTLWSGIPNVRYGWSDCTNNGNCNYHESGLGVWLFWVK